MDRASHTLIVAAIVGFAGFAAVAGPAWAGPPCLDDVQRLCRDAGSAPGATQACLKSHEAELSADCKDHVDGIRKSGQQLAAICVWDIERFCHDVAPGGGRILACLQQNLGDLSPVCKEQFSR
jgi:hypothetical protein